MKLALIGTLAIVEDKFYYIVFEEFGMEDGLLHMIQ